MANPRMDFLSTLKDVSWGGGATEFPPGSGVVKTPGGNPLRISIAIFAYLPAAGVFSSTGINLIEFGHRPLGTGTSAEGGFQTQINVESDGIFMQLSGVRQNANVIFFGTGRNFDRPDPPPGYDPLIVAEHINVHGVPVIQSFDAAPPVFVNRWNCILFSFDALSGSVANDPDINTPIVIPPAPGPFPAGVTITNVPIQNNASPGRFILVPNGHPFDGRLETSFNVDGGYSRPSDFTHTPIGAWTAAPLSSSWHGISMGGSQLGIPQQFVGTPRAPVHLNPDVAYAYVQIWTNQAIPFYAPTVQEAFFFSTGRDLGMVNPSVARSQFGPPAFIFRGNPKTFLKGSSVIGHPLKFPPPPRD